MPWLAGIAVCAAPTIIAMRGQLAFGQGPMKLAELAFLVPAMLEGAAWMLAWRRGRAVKKGQPDGALGAAMWTLALTGAAMNFWHGAAESGVQVGVMYALASLIGFGLVEVLTHADRAAQMRTRRVGLLRAVRYPRIAWAAWSLQIQHGPATDPSAAWAQVWRDRFDCEPGSTRADRKDGRCRVRTRDRVRRGRTKLARQLAAARVETAQARAAVAQVRAETSARLVGEREAAAARAQRFAAERAALTAAREAAEREARDASQRAREAAAEAEQAQAALEDAETAREAAEREARETRERAEGERRETREMNEGEKSRSPRAGMILAAWGAGKEPNCSEIDRAVAGRVTGTARQTKRELIQEGFGPGNVPPEYRADSANPLITAAR